MCASVRERTTARRARSAKIKLNAMQNRSSNVRLIVVPVVQQPVRRKAVLPRQCAEGRLGSTAVVPRAPGYTGLATLK